MSNQTTPVQRDRRRAMVAELMKGGATYREIAAQLATSAATVSRDVAAIREEWRKETYHQFDDMILLDVQRIESALAAIWPSVLAGNLNAIKTMAVLLERKAKTVGYDGYWRAQADQDDGRITITDTSPSLLSGESTALLTSLTQMTEDDLDALLSNLLVSHQVTVIENSLD